MNTTYNINPQIERQARSVLGTWGLDMDTALNALLSQIANCQPVMGHITVTAKLPVGKAAGSMPIKKTTNAKQVAAFEKFMSAIDEVDDEPIPDNFAEMFPYQSSELDLSRFAGLELGAVRK